MSKGRLEDVQKIVDQHFTIYYRLGDFATGVYRNGKTEKRGKNRKIRPKDDFRPVSRKKDRHRGSK